MSTNTELIARLKSSLSPDKLDKEIQEAFAALEAEVERLTTLAHGQHIELYNARLQLAAAQGQLKDAATSLQTISLLAGKQDGEMSSMSDVRGYANSRYTVAIAAPIPQQPAEPRPVYGKTGTRDVDVAEAMKRWDAAQQPAAWPQFTAKECHDLTAMIYGAPWDDAYCEGLVEVLGKYEELRTAGQRPVDPVDSGIPPSGPAEPAQFVDCRYGKDGYACCEGRPCEADVYNDALAAQKLAEPLELTDADCTRIYNEANGITDKNPPISTQRIFAAMRAAAKAKP